MQEHILSDSSSLSVYHFAVILFCAIFFTNVVILSAALSAEKPAEHHHQHPVAAPEPATEEVGLDEHLGSRIPLDAVFSDEQGNKVRLGDLVTGPAILLPVYYSCTNVCNYAQGGLARILTSLREKPGSAYRIISISFNQEETFEQAERTRKMYLAAIGAPFPPDGWRFLTGDKKNIHLFTDAIGFRFQQRGHEFVHPVASVVVTGDGKIVRYLYGTTFLAKDVSLALLEARDGRIGKTIRKAVDFCFTFDPAGKTYVFNILRVSATGVIITACCFLLFLLLAGNKRNRKKSEEI